MSAAGLRLRLCPFCGSEAVMRRSGSVCVVQCTCCRAEGPVGLVTDFIESDENLADDEIWERVTRQAEGAALRGWNGRHWIGNYYPDELDAIKEDIFEVTDDES